jgi:hypothetical protein
MDEQTPTPTKPWITRSVWSFAPALVFYELFAGVLWLVMVGSFFGVSTSMATLLPMIGYLVFRAGMKCAIEETEARVPRGRLWGTSFLVSFVISIFMYVLFQDFLLDLRVNEPIEFERQLSSFFVDSNVPQEQISSLTIEEKIALISVSVALVVLGVWLVMHLLALWLGVRAAERAKR